MVSPPSLVCICSETFNPSSPWEATTIGATGNDLVVLCDIVIRLLVRRRYGYATEHNLVVRHQEDHVKCIDLKPSGVGTCSNLGDVYKCNSKYMQSRGEACQCYCQRAQQLQNACWTYMIVTATKLDGVIDNANRKTTANNLCSYQIRPYAQHQSISTTGVVTIRLCGRAESIIAVSCMPRAIPPGHGYDYTKNLRKKGRTSSCQTQAGIGPNAPTHRGGHYLHSRQRSRGT